MNRLLGWGFSHSDDEDRRSCPQFASVVLTSYSPTMDATSCKTGSCPLNLGGLCSSASFSLCVTTVSSFAAAYRVRSDPWRLAFVLGAYGNLMLLFLCVAALQRPPPPSSVMGGKKQVLRPMFWLLATTLNLTFAYQVTKSMAGPLAVAVWLLAAVVTLAGLWVICLCKEDISSPEFSGKNGNFGSRRARRPRSNKGKKGKKSK